MGKKLLRESNVKFIQHNVRGLQKPEYQEKCIAWVRELNGILCCVFARNMDVGRHGRRAASVLASDVPDVPGTSSRTPGDV
jgi:hypothetical protein